MWLFNGVSSAPQSRHMRQMKQALSVSRHGCRSISLSPGEQAASLPYWGFGCPRLWKLVRQSTGAEISKPAVLLSALSPAPLHVLWERWEDMCSLRQWDAFGEGSKRGWHNREAPGLFCLTCQMCLLWSCHGFAMEKKFLLFIQFLDSLRLGLVWQKIILR